MTEPQTLISAGAHCWSPAASGQPGSKTVTVWWPPQPSKKTASPPEATHPEHKASGSQQLPGFSEETQKIMSKLGDGDIVPAQEGKGEEKPLDRNWTIAEQLRHPVGIVSLQWTPGSLQRGELQAFALSEAF